MFDADSDVGKRYGMLTVTECLGLKPRNSGRNGTYLRCLCDCGESVDVFRNNLRTGNTKSCGCRQRDAKVEVSRTHNLSKSRVYGIWSKMKARCTNPNNSKYHRYGGRGITYCPEWESFENFYADMGQPPTKQHSNERLNNDGNYEPGNCVWATAFTQAQNKSNTRRINLNGTDYSTAYVAKLLGVSSTFLTAAVERGVTIEQVREGIVVPRPQYLPDSLRKAILSYYGKSSTKKTASLLGVIPQTVQYVWRQYEEENNLPKYIAPNPTHPSPEKVREVEDLKGKVSQREANVRTGVSRATIRRIWSEMT